MDNHFSKNLLWLRKQKKLSQSKLAGHVKLTRNIIASYETGKAEPNLEKLSRLVYFFQVDFGQLIQADLSVLPESAIRAPLKLDQNATSQREEREQKELQRSKIVQFRTILTGFKTFFSMNQSLNSKQLDSVEVRTARDLSLMIELAENSIQLNEEMAEEYLT
ncbi:MAG: helix-turn-helix transcriptional regulator [Bacteroidota bacterium]